MPSTKKIFAFINLRQEIRVIFRTNSGQTICNFDHMISTRTSCPKIKNLPDTSFPSLVRSLRVAFLELLSYTKCYYIKLQLMANLTFQCKYRGQTKYLTTVALHCDSSPMNSAASPTMFTSSVTISNVVQSMHICQNTDTITTCICTYVIGNLLNQSHS